MDDLTVLESSDLYTVGWIAALYKELAAAQAMMDEEHGKPADFVQPSSDKNNYYWGRIGVHNIVVASLPDGMYGTTTAAVTASQMLSSFQNIKVGLMVGIGAAIARPKQKRDIRLGDVVVSLPQERSGGVIQYDLVKSRASGEQRVGHLNSPPEALLKALTSLRAQVKRKGSKIAQYIKEMQEQNPAMTEVEYDEPAYIYQGEDNDRLFEASYVHTSGTNCDDCDPAKIVSRTPRSNPTNPRVHYGVIASGNTLFKDAAERDRILEMNDAWQEYAAATAAAYAKEFLGFVNSEILARTPKASEVLNQNTREINTNFKVAREKIDKMELDHHQKEIRDWLSAPDPSTNYSTALETRHEGTGVWFTHGEAFERWKRQPNSFLWLHGIPGCGKTVLSSTIIEHLKSDIKPNQPLLYFYFAFNDQNKQTLENMLRSLTNQLYQEQPKARGPVDELWKSHRNGNQHLSKQSLSATLLALLKAVNNTSIVLDALDESTTRSEVIAWLKNVLEPGYGCRILVTARREEDIEAAFRRWTQPEDRINIQERDIHGDIRAYISHTVRNSSELERWQNRPDVQNEIESELVKKADGMFRWVFCQLDALKAPIDYPGLRRTLYNLPRTLNETYSRILEEIPEERRNQATTILNLLIWSEDPLVSINELVDAVAVDLDHGPGFDPKNRMPVPREVLKLCSSLVRVLWDDSDYVGLAHFSVKEYLTSKHVSKAYESSFNEIVARTAFTENIPSLRLLCWKLGNSRSESRYWRPQLVESVFNLFREQHEVFRFSMLFIRIRDWMSPITPLCYACYNGLTRAVRDLLDEGTDVQGADVNARDDPLYSPLRAAALNGHVTTVQLLLDKGADVTDARSIAAFKEASLDTVVRPLVGRGAGAIANGSALLIEASKRGHNKIVQLLINAGAEVNAGDGVVLQQAVLHGHDTTVQLLLDNGADIDARGEHGTALAAALETDHYTTIQLLLDRNASVSLENLMYALRRYDNRTEILLSILLPYFTADTANQRDEDGWNTLHVAALYKSASIIRRCLDLGIDVHARDNRRRTALHYATMGFAVVKTLLHAGSDIEDPDVNGSTPLESMADLVPEVEEDSGDANPVEQSTPQSGSKTPGKFLEMTFFSFKQV
ncbi:unnamed protein product [Aureobasidium mustum]|uniref:NACHT domain-containing protein n=1 Tax=Aureobasidium mustum TaxID=2773714 RepID=A0A9N8JI28_9PEZI|nr:unnamed protein product [Aureobasidium mustum]